MSFFQSIPQKEALREMAMDRAQDYFDHHNLNISNLSLLSIILPDKKKLLKYPKRKPCDISCDDCECCGVPKCNRSCLEEWIDTMKEIFLCCSCILFGTWFNCILLIDCLLKDDVLKRLNIVRCVFLIYSDGIFVYKPKIRALKCPYLCYLWDAYDNGDEYLEYEEHFVFHNWTDDLIYTYGPSTEKYKNNFSEIKISRTYYVLSKEVADALLEYQQKIIAFVVTV
eukprot:snap_masked-scaffold_22-processed-gene-3.16-mRNA-1 protein AED:1.00 eAED:1.00 QI:0/0/0/0/1/1/2/0/225